MADRVITYSLATQFRNGSYNSTIRFDLMQPVLNYITQFKTVTFRRVTSNGNLRLIQANTSRGTDVFAWAGSGGPVYFSPVANYGRSAIVFAKVLLHELGHVYGSLAHRREAEPLMSPNAGTSNTVTILDYPYFQRFPWRSSARPVANDIRSIFAPMSTTEFDEEVEAYAAEEFSKTCRCGSITWFEKWIWNKSLGHRK